MKTNEKDSQEKWKYLSKVTMFPWGYGGKIKALAVLPVLILSLNT